MPTLGARIFVAITLFLSLSSYPIIVLIDMDDEVIPYKYDAYLKPHHYDRTSCGSYLYGCCEIYIDCVKQAYVVAPVMDVVKLDPEGGNCMGLGEIIEAINEGGPSNGNCIINGQCDMARQLPNDDNVSSGIYYNTNAVDGHCPTGEDIIEMYMSLGESSVMEIYLAVNLVTLASLLIGLVICIDCEPGTCLHHGASTTTVESYNEKRSRDNIMFRKIPKPVHSTSDICPKCKEKTCTICDNSCGTSYCDTCDIHFCMNEDGKVVIGHAFICGDA